MAFRATLCSLIIFCHISLVYQATAQESLNSTVPDKLPSERMKLTDSQSLFLSGTDGTHTYRIPAIITAKHGNPCATLALETNQRLYNCLMIH